MNIIIWGKCSWFSVWSTYLLDYESCHSYLMVSSFGVLVITYQKLISPPYFCLGTGVPRHSAGGIGTFVRTWYVSFAMHMHDYSFLTSEHVFIAPGWCSEMIMGFHEYTYQDREYIIRATTTQHAPCTCLYIQLVTKLYT